MNVNRESDGIIELLGKLISTPSLSRNEKASADLLQEYLESHSVPVTRINHNILVKNRYFNPGLKSILLNTHHDTVQPGNSWTRDPYQPVMEGGKIYGLGSNDAGGSVVALLKVFIKYFANKDLKRNLILVISAEEEISGEKGISSVLPGVADIEFGIVGEPTGMELAIAEKGLMVLDCISYGKAGHAARQTGGNAIYEAVTEIQWFRDFRFPKVSETLGPVKMTVTMIQSGTQHNIIPDRCDFTVDIRTTESYSHNEILEIIKSNVRCELKPRSTRLKPSGISRDHPLAVAGVKAGLKLFGSDALSDQALMPFPTVKIGPGEASRSHQADEYITLEEIDHGVIIYEKILNQLLF